MVLFRTRCNSKKKHVRLAERQRRRWVRWEGADEEQLALEPVEDVVSGTEQVSSLGIVEYREVGVSKEHIAAEEEGTEHQALRDTTGVTTPHISQRPDETTSTLWSRAHLWRRENTFVT